MKSRGIKQRLKKRIIKNFGEFEPLVEKVGKQKQNNKQNSKLIEKINENID